MRMSDWSSDVCSSDLEALSIELTSLAALALLILFFHLFPVVGPEGENRLDLRRLLSGFASPALIAVLALLVLGEGLTRPGVLDEVANRGILLTRQNRAFPIHPLLVAVVAFSSVLTTIPVGQDRTRWR